MPRVIETLLILALIIGVSIWGRQVFAASPEKESKIAISPEISPLDRPVVINQGPLVITGIGIMDDSSGLPLVPFIKYEDDDGDVHAKQLIYAERRGCIPGAGDIPCVPGYPMMSAYPQFQTGDVIRIEGYIHEDRFLVTDITVNP